MAITLKVRKVILANNVGLPSRMPQGTQIPLDANINCEKAEDICIFVSSTLSNSVNLQVVGCEGSNTKDGLRFDIGACMNLPPGDKSPQVKSIPVNLKHGHMWHPFIGLDIYTQKESPRSGRITVWAYIREWVDVLPDGTVDEPYDAARTGRGNYSVVATQQGRGY